MHTADLLKCAVIFVCVLSIMCFCIYQIHSLPLSLVTPIQPHFNANIESGSQMAAGQKFKPSVKMWKERM